MKDLIGFCKRDFFAGLEDFWFIRLMSTPDDVSALTLTGTDPPLLT